MPRDGRPANVALTFSLAIFLPILAHLIRHGFLANFAYEVGYPFIFFYWAVVVSSWWGGFTSGILTAGVSAVVETFYTVAPTHSLQIHSPDDRLALIVFLINSAIISSVFEIARRSTARAKISERNAFEVAEQLKLSEDKYRRLYFSNPEPMWIIDERTMRFLEVNQAAVETYGYSREEFLSMNLKDLVPGERLPILLKNFYQQTGLIRSVQNTLHRTKEGSLIRADIIACKFSFEGIPARLALVHDVTARERANDILERARREAEAASQAKSRFLANMSHEIRTPLWAILGFAELMRDPGQSPADRAKGIEMILKNGDQLAALIDDILDLSKIESNRMEIERIPFNVVELLREVTGILRLHAEKKNLHLQLTFGESIPPKAVSDPTRLRQILTNVIGNAIKFTDSGSISVHAESHYEGERVKMNILVRDSGIGIDRDQLQKLFQPFTQADSATTRLFGGTGLGLALSRSLAKALGGELILQESEPGKGSAFAITIDIGSLSEIEEAEAIPVQMLSPGKRSSHLRAVQAKPDEVIRVLLVEDSEDNRELVRGMLKSSAYEVSTAVNGRDGVSYALHNDYDVVLMDIQMPGMDGFEAVRELRKQSYSKPIIALTAHALKSDRDRCLKAGFNDYLPKPIKQSLLVEAIKRYGHQVSVS